MFVFSQFCGLCGVAYSCLFGFGRFRCFCVSCFCLGFAFFLLLDCFWCCSCFVLFLVIFPFFFHLLFFFMRVEGSGEVAQRATSLGPKPFLFVYFCVFCVFLLSFLCISWKNPGLPPKWAFLFTFLCLPLLLFSLFGLPLFQFLFLCLFLVVCFFLPSCFSCQFLVVAFCFGFVCFLFQDVLLLLSFCLLSCFVLNHNIRFVFALHLVFFLLLFFCFCFLVVCCFWNFGYLAKKKHLWKIWKVQKKWKMQKKRTFWKEQLFCWKQYKNWGFGQQKHKKNNESCVKSWSKVVLKTGPSMLRNKIGPVFNTTFRSFVCFTCCFCFWKLIFFLQGERDFQKQTNRSQNIGPILTQKKGKNWTSWVKQSDFLACFPKFYRILG